MIAPNIRTTWALLLLGITACSAALTNLDEARALWNSHTNGVGTNYTFVYSNVFNGNDEMEFVVDIRFGEVSKVYSKLPFDLGVPTTNPDLETIPTIDDLFVLIEDAQATATSLTVDYNEKYGYPTTILILYSDSSTLDIQVSDLTPYTFLQHELDNMESIWFSYKVSDYEFTLRVSCFCAQDYVSPKRIQVEDEVIVSVVDLTTGMESEFQYDTIPELFQRIQRSIDDFDVEILVSYNPILGFPETLSTDPEYGLMDAGVSIEISDVSTLMGEGAFNDTNIELDNPSTAPTGGDLSEITTSDSPTMTPSNSSSVPEMTDTPTITPSNSSIADTPTMAPSSTSSISSLHWLCSFAFFAGMAACYED